jgi:quinolinate synthase
VASLQIPLPEEFIQIAPEETSARISRARAALGKSTVLLGHHYQRDEIIEHVDYRGDSYKLAKDANLHPGADFIVFCGVHFMAESADILTPPHQRVILPNLAAGCSMADMANIFQVRKAWQSLHSAINPGTRVVPVTYINSAANLKGFVGENNGTVCTSTNAPTAIQWAIEQGDKVLFFPDQHLGRNTAFALGYSPQEDMVIWDPFKPLGGNSQADLQRAKFILWKGHCSVHKRFTVEQIERARREDPGVIIIVHPECELEVVQASDHYGSTERIIRMVAEAPAGSTLAVGTEINLVQRLAKEIPDKKIYCLDPQICPCSTMYRIHPSYLLWILENLVEGNVLNVVTVPEDIARNARLALDQMLRLPA